MKKDRKKSHYIINNKIGIFYKLRDVILTLMLWGLWIYIFYPLVALILWNYFDTNIFYHKSVEEISALKESLFSFLLFSGGIIFMLVVAFIGWGVYNKKRFQYRGNQRRQQPTAISSEMMAQSLKVNPEYIEQSKKARYVQIHHLQKTPKAKENQFKPVHDLNVTSVNLYFSDDWNDIRDKSSFAYTHK